MSDLRPQPFSALVRRLMEEPRRQDSCFDLPKRRWYVPPESDDRAATARYQGLRASTPFGPAAGPQTQMAQNIVLSWLAGARIIEFKTIQILDELKIARPCIDVRNIGFNIEWSQELKLEESAREYAAAVYLIAMAKHVNLIGAPEHARGAADATIFDLSCGYDLKGVQYPRMVETIRSLQNATALLDRLRAEIPEEYKELRGVEVDPTLVRTVSLSTFHGCPPEEIERIATFMLEEFGLHTVVKLNPMLLGYERVRHLLNDVLGYSDAHLRKQDFDCDLQWNDSIDLARRLESKARACGLGIGFKFTNTLVTVNDEGPFPRGEATRYLSGQPLHVISLTLADEWLRATDWRGAVSFSAGIDKHNAADMVAAGCCPVTTCTDLLKLGGYGRMKDYLESLDQRMAAVGARNVEEFIRKTAGESAEDGHQAARANMQAAAERARQESRYRRDKNKVAPKKIKSQLWTFDCINCDKCIPACPNDAIFSYALAQDARAKQADRDALLPAADHQLGIFADFCNECGNCETYCPENGGPFKAKPNFVGSFARWSDGARDNEFCFVPRAPGEPEGDRIYGRMGGARFCLEHRKGEHEAVWREENATARIHWPDGVLIRAESPNGAALSEYHLPAAAFHCLRALLEGVARGERVNSVNARRR